MPVTGRKPNASGQHRHRVKPTFEWQEVPDRPYAGAVPVLPRCRRGSWSAATKRWWAVISAMPHCVLWSEADWQFALDSLSVYEEFLEAPVKSAAAMLAREKILGTTLDFRRDLRIRYVDPDAEERETDGSVTVLADYAAMTASGE